MLEVWSSSLHESTFSRSLGETLLFGPTKNLMTPIECGRRRYVTTSALCVDIICESANCAHREELLNFIFVDNPFTRYVMDTTLFGHHGNVDQGPFGYASKRYRSFSVSGTTLFLLHITFRVVHPLLLVHLAREI